MDGNKGGEARTCWPRRQLICEKLTWEPLAPVPVMRAMQLLRKGFICPAGRHACTTGSPHPVAQLDSHGEPFLMRAIPSPSPQYFPESFINVCNFIRITP